MFVSREVDYGYGVVICLGSNAGRYIKRREIYEKENIPYRYLKKILDKLVEGRIIQTKTGKNGGYKLNVSLKKITLLTILNIIDTEKIKLKECVSKREICGFRNGNCVVHEEFKQIEAELKERLNRVVFSNLIGKE